MNSNRVYPLFQKKAKQLKKIENLYDDITFSNFYQKIIEKDSFLVEDIEIYRNFLSKEKVTLEIGSGTGRIFNRLFLEGYNIYGLEPSTEMAKYIIPKGRERIYPIKIQEFEKVDIQLDTIIIPATTISLFSEKELQYLLQTIQNTQVHIKQIIFDVLTPLFFNQMVDKVSCIKFNDEKFYTANFYNTDNSKVIYNILNSEKLGISEKYVYSISELKELFASRNVKVEIIKGNSMYVMLKGEFYNG